MNEIKLMLGCGPMPIHPQHLEYVDDSWTFIDLYVKDPKIVKMDIRKLEYPDNSVSEIYCSHAVEHLGLKEVVPTFLEWYRVLKPGGKIIINVPDMQWFAKELLKVIEGEKPESDLFNSEKMLMEVAYGNQMHDGEFHKSGFTEKTLTIALHDAGFNVGFIKRIYEAHKMGCLIAEAQK